MKFTTLIQIMNMRKKTLIAVAALLAIALACQLFLKLYQDPEIEKLQTEWVKLREQEGRGVILQDRETLYRQGMSDLSKFRERVYPKSQFARYIGELYNLSAKNGLEIDSITYKPSLNKDEQLLSYTLTLSVFGKYNQLKKFIYDLGMNGNIQVINSVSMVASNTPSASVMQLQLQITSYFKMEGK
jgi:Tfp pilus assembly protein PilO